MQMLMSSTDTKLFDILKSFRKWLQQHIKQTLTHVLTQLDHVVRRCSETPRQ